MSICRRLLLEQRWISTCPVRHITRSSACQVRSKPIMNNIRAGVLKRSRLGNVPITYEQAQAPEKIGETKAWNAWNSSSLHEENRAAETAFEDDIIRSFIKGTFPGLLGSDIILKRRHNVIVISCILLQTIKPRKYYFLIGYTEELLSCLLHCPVKVEIQTVLNEDNMTFRHI